MMNCMKKDTATTATFMRGRSGGLLCSITVRKALHPQEVDYNDWKIWKWKNRTLPIFLPHTTALRCGLWQSKSFFSGKIQQDYTRKNSFPEKIIFCAVPHFDLLHWTCKYKTSPEKEGYRSSSFEERWLAWIFCQNPCLKDELSFKHLKLKWIILQNWHNILSHHHWSFNCNIDSLSVISSIKTWKKSGC